ncbi:hypothetical protein ACFQ07_16095, partial [Actinomadura adrarensis]
LAAAISGARFATIPDAGHFVAEDNPATLRPLCWNSSAAALKNSSAAALRSSSPGAGPRE